MKPNTEKNPLKDCAIARPRMTPSPILTRRIDRISKSTVLKTCWGDPPIACIMANSFFLWVKTRERKTKADAIEAREATTNWRESKPGVPNIKPPFLLFSP